MHGGHFLKSPQCRPEGNGVLVCTAPNQKPVTRHSTLSPLRKAIIQNAKEVLGCFLCKYMQM